MRRFWSKVEKTDLCWRWTAAVFVKTGYGQFYFEGAPTVAHRVAYELEVGPIPKGMDIDHLCRNRLCVNPAHLEVVTRAQNARRGLGTKLGLEQVREIRASSATHVETAERFGVHPTTVLRIRRGDVWCGDEV